MYRVTIRQGWFGQETTIHSEHQNAAKLLTAKIIKDIDSIDSFQFSISPQSPHYNEFTGMTTFVKVTNPERHQLLFEGRVLPTTDSMSSGGQFDKEITCEGLLAFLHDSVQDYYALSNNDLRAFLQHMIDVHNRQVDSFKRLKLGQVTVASHSDNVYKSIDDSKTTYETIQEKLIAKYGGEIRLRHESDGLYLDYMPVIGGQSNQPIRLASNLLSIKRAIDPSAMYSVIKPLGARAEVPTTEETDTDVSQPRLTIATVNNGSPFLISAKLVAQIGVVVHPEVWDDVKTAGALKSKGKSTLDNQRLIKEQFQVSAVDLSLLHQQNVDSFMVGNYHQTINPLMAIDENLRIVGQTLDLCQTLSSTLSIGDKLLSQEDYQLAIKRQNDVQIQAMQAQVAVQTKKLTSMTNDYNQLVEETGRYQTETDSTIQAMLKRLAELEGQDKPIGKIIDISEWQGAIDFNALRNDDISLMIIRVQSGSNYQDKTYLANIRGAQAAGIKYAVYAYAAYSSDADAQTEANDFYSRTQTAIGSGSQPVFYMIDVEEQSADNMRTATEAWCNRMTTLGVPASQQVAYIANHLYDAVNVNVDRFGSIVIPSYGANDGTIANSSKPTHPYDLWQYTSTGSVSGIIGNVDMNTEPSARFKEYYLRG